MLARAVDMLPVAAQLPASAFTSEPCVVAAASRTERAPSRSELEPSPGAASARPTNVASVVFLERTVKAPCLASMNAASKERNLAPPLTAGYETFR